MGKWYRPNEEEREKFLELIAEGKTRPEAAEEVGCTSTQFRTFINGKDDEAVAFAQRYLEVLEAIGKTPSPLAGSIKDLEQVQLAHRVFDEYLLRAFDAERGKSGASNRLLYNLGLLTHESFKPLLEARVRHVHSGAVGLYSALPQIDTERWSLEEQEEFVRLEARRSELLAKAHPEGAKALPAANGSENGASNIPENISETIDAEFEDVTAAG
jgi:hypothetical protein